MQQENIQEPAPSPCIGFLKGQISVPDDFDTMCGDEILTMFMGEDKDEETAQ